MRKVLNRKVAEQGGKCVICHKEFTDYGHGEWCDGFWLLPAVPVYSVQTGIEAMGFQQLIGGN